MAGSLVYMMGPSGAGKDTLIEIAKVRLAGTGGVMFAKRDVTRQASSGGEDFRSISQSAFDFLESNGHFLFSWRAHGLSYGVDRQIEQSLKDGLVVVVNGSRAYLPRAIELYPSLKPVLITVEAKVLATRLKSRGRESPGEQVERLSQPDYEYKFVRNLYIIDNSGELEIAADRFCSFLSGVLDKV